MEQRQTSYTQERLKAPLMNRDQGSRSSHCSMVSSSGSHCDRPYSSSPITSHLDSPPNDCDISQEENVDLPLFNIEKQGDPRISWIMYYEFVVTKKEAFYKLKPGYLATECFPSRIEREKAKGDKKHPCGVPGCTAKPFTRHYDLERHFKTRHKRDAGQNTFFCDYTKCEHKDELRKDHCREHYREYHMEDLLKRGEVDVDAFLSSRAHYVKKQWWRCGRCLTRVKSDIDGWICPDCRVSCESERQILREKASAEDTFNMDDAISCESRPQIWREKASAEDTFNMDGVISCELEPQIWGEKASAEDTFNTDDIISCELEPQIWREKASAEDTFKMDGVIGCGMCENAWFPHPQDPTGRLWVSCTTCQPGPMKTVKF